MQCSVSSLAAQTRGSNHRGAVFLLSVYIVSLSLLILSGVALQRCTTELRAAQLSRNQQQAFHLAEGAANQAFQQIRSGQKPALAVGACTDSTTLTTSSKEQSFSYRICLDATDTYAQRFRIEATGVAQGTAQVVTVLADSRNAPKLQFKHAVYAKYAGFYKATTGGTDTSSPFFSPINPQQPLLSGDLATDSTITLSDSPAEPSIVLGSSSLQGTLYIGPNADPATNVLRINTPLPSGGIQHLSTNEIKTFPPIDIPPGATQLGDLMVIGSQASRCLSSGSYVTGHLVILRSDAADLVGQKDTPETGVPELCTTGPVDLYVTGILLMSGGRLYGQPTGSLPYSQKYSPENLRVFQTYTDPDQSAPQSFFWGANVMGGSLIAGLIYVPKTHISFDADSVVLGGIIAKEMTAMGELPPLGLIAPLGGRTSQFLYDRAVLNKTFPVGFDGTAVRFWDAEAKQNTP